MSSQIRLNLNPVIGRINLELEVQKFYKKKFFCSLVKMQNLVKIQDKISENFICIYSYEYSIICEYLTATDVT